MGEELVTFKTVRKVHEVNNHESGDQMVAVHRNAGLMGPELVKMIKMW